MNIILDCDGVLSDFSGGIIAELNKRTGSNFGIEDVTDWNMAQCLGVESRLIYDIASERGFCEGLEVLPGAKAGVSALQEIGEVYIMTSPIWSSKRWMYERTNWLINHFNLHCSHIIHGSAKELALGADLFVDDKPATVVKWLTARNHRFHRYDVRGAVLWAAPWNIHEQASIPDHGFGAKPEQHIIRTNSWPTLADIAEKI